MIFTEEIIPGFKLPENELIIYAKDQPQYQQLPMWKKIDYDTEGLRIARAKLTWKERFQVFFKGSIWIRVLTFNRPLQPLLIETRCPLQGSAMLDEEVN